MSEATVPVAVLGGTGYVAGELLRLLAHHPTFRIVSAVSTSQVGEKVASAFGHLAGALADDLEFEAPEALAERFARGKPFGVFAATPHGATAAMLDRLMVAAEAAGADLHAVDLSADFRFSEAERYASIYGHPHPAPHRLASFTCAVPEHREGAPTRNATQPGCFVTAVTCAAYPFFALDLVENDVFASAITGSSGNGRKLSEGTHHPSRRSTLYAYSPLIHRHEPEMRMLLGRARDGAEPDVQFVPLSGPFVRGIHATLRMTLKAPMSADELLGRAKAVYAKSAFVSASLEPPKLADVVGTNRCRLGIAARGRTLVVTSVIDNLVKGAAGGGVQWMNRLFGLPDDAGLRLPGLGWF